MTFAGRDALSTGVTPAKAGAQLTSPHTHGLAPREMEKGEGGSQRSGLACAGTWVPTFARKTFAGRDALSTGVTPAEAGALDISPHILGLP